MKYLNNEIIKHYEKNDPKILEYILLLDFEALPSYRENTNKKDYFLDLCRNIIGQQLSGKAAQAINKKFTEYYDSHPSPEKILKTSESDLREVGLSFSKIKYIKDLSEKSLSGELNLLEIQNMNDDEIIKSLVNVKGIGPWTAEMFLMFSLKREDVFSYGDLGLKKGLQKIYNLETVTEELAQEITNKWRPYRTYGSLALWKSLEN